MVFQKNFPERSDARLICQVIHTETIADVIES